MSNVLNFTRASAEREALRRRRIGQRMENLAVALDRAIEAGAGEGMEKLREDQIQAVLLIVSTRRARRELDQSTSGRKSGATSGRRGQLSG